MKLSRNESCHCGSGKKYKNCCLKKEHSPYCDHSKYEKQKTASEQRRADEEIKDVILNETDFGRIVKRVGSNKHYLKEELK
jgi:hypothetical protein